MSKPKSVKSVYHLSVRIKADQMELLRELAQAEDRSLSKVAERIIRDYFTREETHVGGS